jgi:SAM-dependent methyltransferase
LAHAERIPLLANAVAGSHFASLIKVQVVEPIAEIALLPRILTLTPIADRTSQAVRDQYEENPYPRWHRLPGGMPQNGLASGGQAVAAGAARLGAPRERTLIAGCGTGQHPVSVALKNPDSDFLAIDLSRSSLAYAQRMASEYGVRNVEFAQADLLSFPETGLSFDTISCVGVLHHLGRPVEGLHALRRLMAHERGLKVAVYTESGRQGVVAAIRLREKFALPGTANGIRSLRQMIWKLAANDSAREIAMTADFYSLSGCRDLVFHVMEHRYTIPEFAALVESAGLRIETVLAPAAVLARFEARFPEAGSRTDVTRWDQFEIDNPGVFGSMYRFMLAKRSP